MKTKKVLYTTLAVLTLATAGFAPVLADDTTSTSSDVTTVAQDIQEVKLDITVTRDAQNRIVFQIKPDTDLGLSYLYLTNIRVSYLNGKTPILATDKQGMGFTINPARVYEKVWMLRLSGTERDPYKLDDYSKSRAGNYRFEIDEIVNRTGTDKKYHVTGSVDFGMNDQYEYAPLSKTETNVVEKTEAIPYVSTEVEDATLSKGEKKVTTAGVNGEKTVKVRQTLVGGKVTSEEVISETITKEPVVEVVAVGTKETVVTPPSTSDKGKKDDKVTPPTSSSSSQSTSSTKTSSSNSTQSPTSTQASSKDEDKDPNGTTSISSSQAKTAESNDKKATDNKSKKSLPNTGEQLSIAAIVGGVLLAVVAFVVLKRNKSEK
ncbi:Cell wall-binding protein [Streptococcus sp. DD10]|uniref:G5 domain-containing protein n=1 Tax=Streptococcus sp. DD10 TaxID=1777878 RepID=UPI00079AD3DE|nr:G5 domain-containing protein [Streptococcus sp. DD10]KXT74458.1 Cell wall-binding protein [Streptococcus sp. DD10]